MERKIIITIQEDQKIRIDTELSTAETLGVLEIVKYNVLKRRTYNHKIK